MRLEGRGAVVTGGGSGIGQAIAWALAAEGCRVVVAGRGAEQLAETTAKNSLITAIQADVGDRKQVAELFREASYRLGQIHILVNSAGINVPKRMMHELTPEDWDRMFAINVTGAFNCMREVLPEMRGRRDGLIINISSTSGKRASLLGGVGYNASKFAMTALGTSVALEDGRNGIRVTTICPGEVETPILKNRPTPPTPEHRARMLQPEDVAAAVIMVACLPPRANVAELVIKPTTQDYA
jgi:NAD(P)-dependent dehydrogenase (short-subunit alcohol dehydrogenase family)